MKKVMMGTIKSRRHNLFLNRRERERCSGSETSLLYQLSNPGFLGGNGVKDTIVINQLKKEVFIKYFEQVCFSTSYYVTSLVFLKSCHFNFSS